MEENKTTDISKKILIVFSIVVAIFSIGLPLKEFQNDTYFKKVKKVIKDSIKKGIEIWNLELNFTPEGVSIYQLKETTDEILKLTK